VQGRLRKEVISVTIGTVCDHCNQPFTITLDSKMNFHVSPEDATPLIFSPQIDWASFSDPNIIQAF
jgi:hypothetical protein